MTNTTSLRFLALSSLFTVTAAGCAARAVTPAAPVAPAAPAAAAAGSAADAGSDAAPVRTHDIAVSFDFAVDKIDGHTECRVRGDVQHKDAVGDMYVATGATVDSGGDAAVRDCLEAVFDALVEDQITNSPKPAPAAQPAEPTAAVDAYSYDDEVVETPGPAHPLPQVVVKHNWRDKAAIRRVLHGSADQLAACAPRKLAGTVTVQFVIGTSGAVAGAAATTHVDDAIDTCVVDTVKGMAFPPSDHVTQVVYPVAFHIPG